MCRFLRPCRFANPRGRPRRVQGPSLRVDATTLLRFIRRPTMDKPWVKFYDKGVPARLDYPPDLLVHRFLEKTAEKFPDRPATIFPAAVGKKLLAGMLTFRDLEDAANRFANALASLGVKKGDRVG